MIPWDQLLLSLSLYIYIYIVRLMPQSWFCWVVGRRSAATSKSESRSESLYDNGIKKLRMIDLQDEGGGEGGEPPNSLLKVNGADFRNTSISNFQTTQRNAEKHNSIV